LIVPDYDVKVVSHPHTNLFLSLPALVRDNERAMLPSEHPQLIAAARAARENAHAPFSNFKVGAALRSKSGKIFTGCNVENASYGLTICAERNAIFKAISEGERSGGFDAIAVFTAAEKLTPPCGACRQIIWEFCGDCEVILSNTHGQTESFKMSALLPRAFDASNL
jgi:cytidine deaminase